MSWNAVGSFFFGTPIRSAAVVVIGLVLVITGTVAHVIAALIAAIAPLVIGILLLYFFWKLIMSMASTSRKK